jgi:hypothetical protein
MYGSDKSGKEHNLQFAAENDWIADLGSFYSEKPSKLYIEALEPSVIIQLEKKELIFFYTNYPKNNGDHSLFVAGNDEDAKTKTKSLLTEFGWRIDNVIDIGDITAARAMESYLILSVRMRMTFGVPVFNIKVIKP